MNESTNNDSYNKHQKKPTSTERAHGNLRLEQKATMTPVKNSSSLKRNNYSITDLSPEDR